MAHKQNKVSKYVSKMDFFSSPLQFTLGPDDKAKRTFFGGMLTIVIMVLSLSYFAYVCTLYFTHQIQPTISTTSIQLDKNFEMNVSDDLYGFRITLDSGQLLDDYEKQVGKRYLSFLAIYNYYEGQEKKQAQFPMIPCKSEKLIGYMCIDKKSIKNEQFEQFQFKMINDTQHQNTMALYFVKCNEKFLQKGEQCETDEQKVFDILYHFGTELEVMTTLIKFNPLSKKYEEMQKSEYLYFDENLLVDSEFSFQITQTRKIDGFIIQSTQIDETISDFIKSQTIVSKSKLQIFQDLEIYGLLGFELLPNVDIQSIQYQQFTTILAQFISVLQALLVLGLLCNSFSQMEIVQDLLNLQLKVYYKKTALDILKQSEKPRTKNYEQLNQYQLFQSIQDQDIRTKIPAYTKLGFFERFKILVQFKRDTQKQKTGSKEVKIYKHLLQKSMKSLDIYHIQKELLKTQMMVRLMLTAEQYAAIQMCGCSILRENQNGQIEQQDGQNQLIKQNEQTEQTKLNIQEIEDSIQNKKQQEIQKNLNNIQNIDKNNDKNNAKNSINNINKNNGMIENTHNTHTNNIDKNNGNNNNNNINNNNNNNNNYNNNNNIISSNNIKSNSNNNNTNSIHNNDYINNINKSNNNNNISTTNIQNDTKDNTNIHNNNNTNDNNNNDKQNHSYKNHNNTNINDNNNMNYNNNLDPGPQQIQNMNEFRVNDQGIENHLETIELIDNDEIILQQYINQYMNNNKIPQSELDKRILQSMIGTNNIKQQKQYES